MEVVTNNAMIDTLSERDYRDMFDEMKEGRSLRATTRFIAETIAFSEHSNRFAAGLVSHASWDKYDKNPDQLTRRMRNELRVASGIDPLPLTLHDVVDDVDPNAMVVRSALPPGRALDFVVLSYEDDPKLNRLREPETVEEKPKRLRRRIKRPTASLQQDGRRRRLGLAWKDVIEAGLSKFEQDRVAEIFSQLQAPEVEEARSA